MSRKALKKLKLTVERTEIISSKQKEKILGSVLEFVKSANCNCQFGPQKAGLQFFTVFMNDINAQETLCTELTDNFNLAAHFAVAFEQGIKQRLAKTKTRTNKNQCLMWRKATVFDSAQKA